MRGPTRWWHPKRSFKAAVLAAVGLWIGGVVATPWWVLRFVVALLGGMVLSYPMVVVAHFVRRDEDGVTGRHQAILDDLLNRLGGEKRVMRLTVLDGEAVIEFEDRWSPEQVEEAVRFLWLSRIYPLKSLKVRKWLASRDRTVERGFTGRAAEEPTHRYGPRPYGWLPDED